VLIIDQIQQIYNKSEYKFCVEVTVYLNCDRMSDIGHVRSPYQEGRLQREVRAVP
jgi:hypothetical protein